MARTIRDSQYSRHEDDNAQGRYTRPAHRGAAGGVPAEQTEAPAGTVMRRPSKTGLGNAGFAYSPTPSGVASASSAAALPSPAATPAHAESAGNAQKSGTGKMRGRLQMLLAAACAIGVFAGVRLTHRDSGAAGNALTEATLTGTWELETVGGEPIGPGVESGVLAQRVTFGDDTIKGETRLLAATNAGTTAMPFPDESVEAVKMGDDGHEITVSWRGTYSVLPNNRLELRIGGAQYRLAGTVNPQTHALEFDHDAILTYKGLSRYHLVPAKAAK